MHFYAYHMILVNLAPTPHHWNSNEKGRNDEVRIVINNCYHFYHLIIINAIIIIIIWVTLINNFEFSNVL